jgi:hypothetical protein
VKSTLLIRLLMLCIAAPCAAQSLDIGGVELTLGADANAARDRLERKFRLRVDSTCAECTSGKYQLVAMARGVGGLQGTVSVSQQRIGTITKYFVDAATNDFRKTYTAAVKELYGRGGSVCSMQNRTLDPIGDSTVAYVTNDLATGSRNIAFGNFISRIETQCGRYRLSLQLPASKANRIELSLKVADEYP